MALICLLVCLPAFAAAAPDPLYRFAPPGAWVESIAPDYGASEPKGSTSNGSWYLLLDRQINITADGDDYYEHVAAKVLDEHGVEKQSTYDVSIDPTFQTADIHFLRITRHGKTIDASRGARITALPQETQLRERIYNGAYNIDILLADVRVGDIVEYGYSIHSRPQLFRGHYAGTFTVGWSDAMHRQHVRVRAPARRNVRVAVSDGTPPPPFVSKGDVQELVLDQRDPPAIQADGDEPDWFRVWPVLQISDFESWHQVAQIASEMYGRRDSKAVAALAGSLRAGAPDPKTLALRALQYVQEQIRYVSISIGPGTYRPATPDTVLERRYGDCKDKSVLLTALLHELGFEAQPAFVHSYRGHVLPQDLPTPYAFDHAIVRAQIDGRTYWLDGTRSRQSAAFMNGASLDFENALPLAPAADGLVPIPAPDPDSERKDVSVDIDLRAGTDKPAKMEVVTRYRGTAADYMRASFARMSAEQMRDRFLKYVSRYYASARSAGDVKVNDRPDEQTLELIEHYVLDQPFTLEEGVSEFVLHADELYMYSDAITARARRAPFALAYPLHVKQKIVAHTPGDWQVEPEHTVIENAAFRYSGDIAYANRTLTATYEYQALKNSVPPADFARYVADRKRFSDDVGYQLTYDPKYDAKAKTGHYPSLAAVPTLALMVSIGGGLLVWRRVMHWDPPAPPPPESGPEGIRGWLILPAIGVLMGPAVMAWTVWQWVGFIEADTWEGLTRIGTVSSRGSSQLFVALILLLSGVLMGLQVANVRLLFTRRTSLPRLYIAEAWASFVYGTAIVGWTVWAEIDATPLRKFVIVATRDLVLTFAWTLYMLHSTRVRRTFQRRRALSPATAGPDDNVGYKEPVSHP